ncbi:MAG: ATP-binding protein [Candidatus Kapabacteria bacterium]|nr:ATP-binding protein [Candidatus Kapabacteria bacterium]
MSLPTALPLSAQQIDMQAVTYNLSNVLPTDLIKSTVQDGRGFIWAASDAGVVRFDGRHSTLHKNLPSPYIKALLKSIRGEVLVLTDLGLVKIREDADSVRFPIVLRGGTTHSDSTLFYAKSLFEASNGDLWLGEPDAIVRLRKGTMKRFSFGARYTADSFTRTFSFAEEADGTILAASQRGHGLFRFDVGADVFKEIPVGKANFTSVSAILLRDRQTRTVWIATTNGVYETSLEEKNDSRRTWKQVCALRDVSCFAADYAGNVYIGTWYLGLHFFNAGTKIVRALSYIDSKTINDVRVAGDGNVWVSADDGIALLHPYTFLKPDLPFDRPFIQQVLLVRNGDILVSDGAAVLRISPYLSTTPNKEILRISDRDWGAIIALAERADGTIVCATSGGYVLEIRGTAWTVLHKEEQSENYYFALYNDSQGTLWLSQNPDARLFAQAPDNKTWQPYNTSRGLTGGASVIRESKQGTLFVGGRDSAHYLFRYNRSQDRFENLSVRLPFAVREPFTVHDLVAESDTSVWLATSYGIVHYHNRKADTIPFSGEIARRNTLAVTIAPQGGVIFATDHGVYMYTHNQIIAVDLRLEKTVMSPGFRSLVIDKATQLWLGTRSGLLLSRQFAKLVPQTQMPTIVALRANGTMIGREHREHTSGLYLQAEFTALAYPAEKVRYQTRLVLVRSDGEIVGADTAWKEARYDAEEIYPSVSSGEYLLQIRAQQEGFLWSEPTQYRFSVQPAWYARWWAWLLYGLAIIGLMYGTARYWARHLEKRNRVLKRMVEERTSEIERQLGILDEQAGEIEIANSRLQEQNLQLVQLNNEKNEFLGIVAHDLKNPLTGIMMTTSMIRSYSDKMSPEDMRHQIQRIEDTAKRMHTIITELLDVNAIETGHINITISNVNISTVTKGVVEDFRERAEAKSIKLHFRSEQDSVMVLADGQLIVQVLENIVSNAVKYSPTNKNVFVSVTRPDSRRVRVTVRDEGPGLTPQDKENLFRKFAKLSARPTAGEDSTGLGLSIVKRMIEAMHGTVSCESELGQGAAFIVDLPAVPASLVQ